MRKRGFEVLSTYLGQDIIFPERKTSQSAGYDIAAAESVRIPAGKIAMIPTGIKAYMQADEYLGIHIRSGLAVKHGLCLINGQGIIDADYYNNPSNEGHIMVAVLNAGAEEFSIEKGTRIAQGIFYKFLTTDDDNETSAIERSGGFGSTGNS